MPANPEQLRYYLVCKPTQNFLRAYQSSEQVLADYLRDTLKLSNAINVLAQPLLGAVGKAPPGPTNPFTDVVIVVLGPQTPDALNELIRKEGTAPNDVITGGPDLQIGSAEHWCPRDATDPIFGNRAAANTLINAAHLKDQRVTGKEVNVVIVDQGVTKAQVKSLGGRFGHWEIEGVRPGAVASPHGMMITRSILSIAPDVTIFDLPVIPERILDIPSFLSDANAVFLKMMDKIAAFQSGRSHSGPWVIVNAWSIFDRRHAVSEKYCDDPTHPFNNIVSELVRGGHDMVFCAGNCGQFCPDGRCAPPNIGPGASILGANSLEAVLTVGAVRTDGLWLGYSAQGPGQSKLGLNKPDLCAPSQFREDDDASIVNRGTSTACALAAGVVAALRENWPAAAVSPQQLIDVLKETAHSGRSGWEHRLGSGIIDAKAAYQSL